VGPNRGVGKGKGESQGGTVSSSSTALRAATAPRESAPDRFVQRSRNSSYRAAAVRPS
jgi:hypothetical protein